MLLTLNNDAGLVAAATAAGLHRIVEGTV